MKQPSTSDAARRAAEAIVDLVDGKRGWSRNEVAAIIDAEITPLVEVLERVYELNKVLTIDVGFLGSGSDLGTLIRAALAHAKGKP